MVFAFSSVIYVSNYHTMEISAGNLLMLITIIQLSVFALILFSIGRSKRNDHLLLGFFFISLALNMGNLLLIRSYNLQDHFILHLAYLGSPFAFLYPPLFYFYILSLTTFRYKLNRSMLPHFIPFIVLLGYILYSYTILPAREKVLILNNGGIFPYSWYIVLTTLLHVQIILYITASILRLASFKKHAKLFSTLKVVANLKWIQSIFMAITCLWLIDFSRYLSSINSVTSKSILEIMLFTGFNIFFYYFIYKALNHPLVFLDIEYAKDTRKKSLSEMSRESYLQKLRSFMERRKPYLDPELTLVDLSEQCGIPVRSLSEVIRFSYDFHFNDFINMYRVMESEKLLIRDSDSKTILEIQFEVGFNSKSSFNKAFKKQKGMTPSEFKRNMRTMTLLEAG